MARIPLTQIPNAPELLDPVLTKYPDTRVDLSEMARRMQQGGIQQGSFDGPAKGMQAMGEAVGQAGNVFQQVGEKMADAKDQSDLAQAELIMQQARAAQANDMLEQPQSQWVPNWEGNHRPNAEKQLDALHMSRRTQERVVMQWRQFDALTRSSLAYDAHKQTIEQYRGNTMNAIHSDLASGNYDGARQKVMGMTDSGLAGAEEAGRLMGQIDTTQKVAAQKQRMDQAYTVVDNDSELAMKVLGEGGDPEQREKLFPGLSAMERHTLLVKARENFSSARHEAYRSFGDELAKGNIATDADLDAFMQAHRTLHEGDREKLQRGVINSQGPLQYGKYNELYAAIVSYNKADDPSGAGQAALQERITTDLPAVQSRILSQKLRTAAAPDKRPDFRLSTGVNIIRKNSAVGNLGVRIPPPPSRNRRGEIVIESGEDAARRYTANNVADHREMMLIDDLQHWVDANPKASLSDVQAHVQKQMDDQRAFYGNGRYTSPGNGDETGTEQGGMESDDGDAMAPLPPGQPKASPGQPNTSDAGRSSASPVDFIARATGYHPVAAGDPARRMEGGFEDRMGHPIHTLEDFREGRSKYVTVAMDAEALPYGTMLESPDLPGVPFRVADTGSAFQGRGTGRIDIARRTAKGANSEENNRPLRFKILS